MAWHLDVEFPLLAFDVLFMYPEECLAERDVVHLSIIQWHITVPLVLQQLVTEMPQPFWPRVVIDCSLKISKHIQLLVQTLKTELCEWDKRILLHTRLPGCGLSKTKIVCIIH